MARRMGIIAVALVALTAGPTAGVLAGGSALPAKLVGAWNRKACITEFTTTYSVSGAKVTVAGLKGVFVTCFAKATYGWQVAGKTLTLKAIADKIRVCAPRKALLDGAWKSTKL